MRLPSVNYLASQAGTSLQRFFLPFLFACMATVAAIIIVKETKFSENIYVHKSVFTGVLGLSFSLGCCIFSERWQRHRYRLPVYMLCLLLMVLYFFFGAPGAIDAPGFLEMVIFIVLLVVAHLWVSFAGYITANSQTGFWRINEIFFTRIIISGIYSGVLFGGLCLALVALEKLLNFNLYNKIYADLWIVIAGIFNTWFFLTGIPKDFDSLNTLERFPNWLKVFTQYVLLPLVSLYLLILYTYGIKIIIQGHLPNGWVSVLIISYSVAGILALLLVNPIKNEIQNKWVLVFSRFFYIALLPLIILLFVALGARVHQYGITEDRYYLVIIGCWLTALAIYNIFSKVKSIKIIPVSLSIVGLITLFGPWSAFNVSANSQANRLSRIFTKYKIHPKVIRVHEKQMIDSSDYHQINAILDYAVSRDYISNIKDLYTGIDINGYIKHMVEADTPKRLNRTVATLPYYRRGEIEDTLLSLLNITTKDNKIYSGDYELRWLNEDELNIAGYKKALKFSFHNGNSADSITHITYNNNNYDIIVHSESNFLEFIENGKTLNAIQIDTWIDGFKKLNYANYSKISNDSFSMALENEAWTGKIYFSDVSIFYTDYLHSNTHNIISLEGWLLLK